MSNNFRRDDEEETYNPESLKGLMSVKAEDNVGDLDESVDENYSEGQNEIAEEEKLSEPEVDHKKKLKGKKLKKRRKESEESEVDYNNSEEDEASDEELDDEESDEEFTRKKDQDLNQKIILKKRKKIERRERAE